MDSVSDLTERLRKLLTDATPGPWHLCQHLKSVEDDKACHCGYRGVVFGPETDVAYAVFQPGHELPRREEEWGSEPARYDRATEIANSQLITELRNVADDLLTTLETLTQENARLRFNKREWAEHFALHMNPDRDLKGNPLYVGDPAWSLAEAAIRFANSPARKALGGGDE